MKITIRQNKLEIDGVEKKVADLTTDLLEELLDKAINQEVVFDLVDTKHPLYDFFNNLMKDTLPDSDFIKEITLLETEIKTKEDKLKEDKSESLDRTSDKEDDLTF